jgi:hypothetical protein
LSEKEQQWFALDGKELRGSIASGEKRGTALVQAVAHKTGPTVTQTYYCGQKESEKPVVRQVLKENNLAPHEITLDALHCNWQTLKLIAGGGGKYLVGLKNNQKQLLQQVIKQIDGQAVLYQAVEIEKGMDELKSATTKSRMSWKWKRQLASKPVKFARRLKSGAKPNN